MGPGPGVADDVAVMERGGGGERGVPNPRGSHPRILKRVFLGDKIQSVIALAFYDHVPGSSRETGAEVSGRGI